MSDFESQLHLHKQKNRVALFDGLRGVAVVLMVFAHTAHFLSTNNTVFVLFLVRIANIVTFSLFLIASGVASYYAYIIQDKTVSPYEQFVKVGKRILYLYFGYAIIVLISSLSSHPTVSLYGLTNKIFFGLLGIDCPPFSEFILSLLLYAVTTYLLKNLYEIVLGKTWLAITVASIVYFIGNAVYAIVLPFPFEQWKALFFGSPMLLRFPLFQYFPIFLSGMLIGKSYNNHSIDKFRYHLYLLTIVFGLLSMFAFARVW
jgi:uncharacterized membrane protein